MEKNRKELKVLSIVILAFIALTMIKALVTVCVNGLPQATEIPQGMTAETVKIVAIVFLVLGFVVAIPQIYVGVKGILVANGAAGGKGHIIWALILAILAGVSVISGISELTKGFSVDSVLGVLDPAIDLALFVSFYVYARRVANET